MGAVAVGLALGGSRAGAVAPAGGGSPFVPALAVGLALLLAAARARAAAVIAAAALVAGAAAGAARVEAIDAPGRALRDGTAVSARAHLLEAPRRSRFGSWAPVRLETGPHAGAAVLARSGRDLRFPPGSAPGDGLRVSGSVARPRHKPGDRFDFAAYLRRRGIAGELSLDALGATGARRGGAAGALDRARGRAERAIAAGLGSERAALARGMVLGQDERIDPLLREDFRDSGLAHLLAVSGQNVMLLGALAFPLLAAAGASLGLRLGCVLALIAVYVPLAGAGPSLQRAGVMGAAGLVATAASRPASRSYALLLAAAATLALNPRVWADPGWQLSFAAVAGILLGVTPLRRALRGLPGWLAEGVAITIAATVATAPLLAHHFGTLPAGGLPANVLALPVVAPIMWIGMMQAALAQLAVLAPLAPTADTLTGCLGTAAGPLLGYLAWLAGRFAELPGARVGLPLRSTLSVALTYAALAGLALGARRGGRRLEPGATSLRAGWRRLPRRRRAAVAILAAGVAALVSTRLLAPPAPPRTLTVSFLDVGQGDATLVQDRRGTAVLFDGGPPEARVVRLLRRAGVRRLALVVATHQSRDHQGGLHEVIERYPVGLLLDGGDHTRDRDFRTLAADADRRGIRRVRAYAPLSLRAGSLQIELLSPAPRRPGPPPDDPNQRGVVAIVSSEGFRLLLSADAESEALAPLALPRVDAMKVPHHGSADPGLPELLRRLRPAVAGIEVGAGNDYGHPKPSTLRALDRAGVRTYRTDRDGTVRLTWEHGRARVATHR